MTAHLHPARCRRAVASAPTRSRRASRKAAAAARHRRRDRAHRLARHVSGSSRWSRWRRPQGRIAYGPVDAGDVDRAVRRRLPRRRRASAGARAVEEHPVPQAADAAHLRPLRRHRSAVARGLSRAWRLQGPRARARARRRRRSSRRSSQSGLRGRGGAGFPTGIKWKTVADAPAAAEIHRLQRRRGRQRHLRRPHDHGGRSLRADRGHGHRRHRRRRDQGLHLYPLRISARHRGACSAAIDGARSGGLLGASVAGLRPRLRHRGARRRRRLCLRRGDLAARKPRRQARPGARQAAAAGASRACSASRPSINNVLSLASVPIILAEGARGLSRFRHGPLARHDADPARRQHQAWRPVRDRLRHHARRARRRHRRRHAHRPAGARGAGRRPARRLFPARAVRHAVRLRGVRRRATG